MCGISGIVGQGWERVSLEAMVEVQAHRGPDDTGLYVSADHRVGLGHNRLSIVDLSSAGHQPMHSADGRYVLVYNGEIYNHADFRPALEAKGIRFRGHADTETLLYLLIHEGEDILPRLNGIFAFAFYDTRTGYLLLARDHMGVKPLYFAFGKKGWFVFASEIKALFASGAIEPRLNLDDLLELLMYHFIAGERTAFDGVRELLPGHKVTLKQGRVKISTFWDPLENAARAEDKPVREEEAAEDLRRRIEAAVIRQLMADVPLGLMLSGGLDSGIVAAYAHQTGITLHGYCYIDPERGYDEYQHADVIARQHGVVLKPVTIDEDDVPALLHHLTHHYDEPLPRPHHLAAYAVAKAARADGNKVLLTGEGGDELFGGYQRYVHFSEEMARTNDQSPLVFAHNRVALPRIKRFWDYRLFSNAYRFWLAQQLDGQDLINRQLIVDQKTFLQHFLQRSDRMGMAVGLENRVPLLDVELVEYVNGLPGHEKVRHGQTKVGMRAAARPVLPEAITTLPKQPFDMPLAPMLKQGPVAQMVDDLLLDNPRCGALFDVEGLRQTVYDMRSDQPELWKIVWMALTFEVWLRAFKVAL